MDAGAGGGTAMVVEEPLLLFFLLSNSAPNRLTGAAASSRRAAPGGSWSSKVGTGRKDHVTDSRGARGDHAAASQAAGPVPPGPLDGLAAAAGRGGERT